MLISQAFAQDTMTTTAETAAPGGAPNAVAPGPASSFSSLGLIVVMSLLFYVLLIRPQQKRFKEHSTMLSGLQKGDKVVTGGGLIGTIDDITGNDEVIVDLGNGLKVTALRSTIHGKDSPLMRKPALAEKKADKKDAAKK